MSKYEPQTHLTRSPTLLIGIGGIGGHIVSQVNNAMNDYDRSCVKMIVMDTDTEAIDRMMAAGIPYIQTSKNQNVSEYLEANPEYLDWFPTDPLINGKSLIQGAGQIRSVSRLGALSSKASGEFEKIKQVVDEMLGNQGDPLRRAVRVMIVGSVTGGTGSGLGIQLPFYIRKVLSNANVPNVLIRGLFLMPSLTEEKQDTDAKKSAVNVNGYAFLKELNAFYRAQKLEESDNLLRIEEYVPGLHTNSGRTGVAKMAAMIPYDFLYLVEKQSNQGNLGNMENYIERSAQIVMNQLFSPLSSAGFSSEDNLITSIVPAGGMNRYCGAGISNAIYPKDEVVRYCTVRYAGELIGDYWLKIDDTFKQRDEHQRRLKKTNPNLETLDQGDTYCQIFDEMCDPKKSEVVGEVAALRNELTISVIDPDAQEDMTGVASEGNVLVQQDLVETLMGKIDTHLNEVFDESGLPLMAQDCRMSVTVKSIPEDVKTDANKAMKKLHTFKTATNKKVSELTIATAEEILPASLAVAQGCSKDSEYNLYVALEKKHPIIARYILYKIRKKLIEKKEIADAYLNSEYISLFEKDYYDQGEGDKYHESPSEAIGKVKPGLFAGINIFSAEYTLKVQEIIDDVGAEAQRYSDMALNSLRSVVCRIVLERINVLIELYEKFFKELKNIMEQKRKETERLEVGRGEGVNEVFAGDRYICSNAECKQFLYSEFLHNVTDKETEMSDEVKKGFFDKMFGEYESLLVKESNPAAIVSHLSYNQLFEEGVLQPVVSQFAEGGFKHLDMGIMDAIYKQYQIEKRNPEAKKDSAEFKEYFRSICKTLTTLSAPYMIYETQIPGYISGGRLSYSWGLNNQAVVDHQTGSVDGGTVDMAKLHGMFDSSYNPPIVDDSFSPYTLVCYATIYDLRIENCISYRVGSVAQQKYAERLQNLTDREFVLGKNKGDLLDVVHPHLDRRWHEHAYLPELMGYDDEEMCSDIRLAFILAMALKRCKYVEDKNEGLKCWCFIESSNRTGKEQLNPIYVDGEPLETKSVFALYRAFDRNRVIVADVLQFANAQKEQSYKDGTFEGITFDAVVKHPLIEGLLTCTKDSAEKASEKFSILDLIYDLYRNSGDRDQSILLITALEEYLWSYCLKMMNENENKAKVLYNEVLFKIGDETKVIADTSVTFFNEDIEHFKRNK